MYTLYLISEHMALAILTCRIAGNFGEVDDIAESHQFKTRQYYFIHYRSMHAEVFVIAKFKIHQCILMTNSPNLMLAKVSRYTVLLYT